MSDLLRPIVAAAMVLGSGLVAGPTAQAADLTRAPTRAVVSRPLPLVGFGPMSGRSMSPPSPWRPGQLLRGGALPRPARPRTSPVGGWSVEPTPNAATLRNGSLVSEACPSSSACTAVGNDFNAAGSTVPLAERWDGSRWRVQAAADPPGATLAEFTGVSCATARACTAVGYYFDAAGDVLTLAEAWNGDRWRVQPTPSLTGLGSGLFAVSCTSPGACTAVGIHDSSSGTSLTLAERWNGSSWSVQATPISLQPVPSELLGVSCTGPNACTAVGAAAVLGVVNTLSGPLAMVWNGETWTIQATPSPAGNESSGLASVSCTSATACTAVGSYLTQTGATGGVAVRWNGATWQNQVVPSPAGTPQSELGSVSCSSAHDCTAVGNYFPASAGSADRGRGGGGGGGGGGGSLLTLAERWNGSAWRIQATANPAASTADSLSGLSCTAARACSAVGSYTVASLPTSQTLAETWNGARWSLQPVPSPAGANASEIRADSCLSPRACTAVGFYAKNVNVVDTLAEVWNGSRWRVQPTPNPVGASSSAFASVSCPTARACTGVGETITRRGVQVALAEAWNGSKWAIQTIPDPAGGTGVLLNAVSCTSARACTAVGFYDSRAGIPVALVERWDGARWSIVTVPRAATRTWLFGVDCPSARACTAVGYLNNGGGDAQPLAEAWNGRSWRIEHVPLPSGSPGGAFMSVSCTTPTGCTATGASFSGTGAPLAERWNGTRWRAQATIAPPNYQSSTSEVSLMGVSCSSARACTAVGDYAPGGFSTTFAETWNSTSWNLRLTATPAGTIQSILTGISCPASDCTAVGASLGPSGVIVTLAEVNPSAAGPRVGG